MEIIAEAAAIFRERVNKPPPLDQWVKDFIKEYSPKGKKVFKKVKWRPMDKKRQAAQDTEDITQWFAEYTHLQRIHKIYLQNI